MNRGKERNHHLFIFSVLVTLELSQRLVERNHPVQARDSNIIEDISQFYESMGQAPTTNVILYLNCSSIAYVLEVISQNGAFNSSYNYILVGKDLNSSMALLAGSNIHFGSQITLILPSRVDAFDIYKIKSTESLKRFPIRAEFTGTYSGKAGVRMVEKRPGQRNLLEKNIASVCVLVSSLSIIQ